MFKPGQDAVEGAWTAEVFAGLDGPGFRVPPPVRAADGAWVVDGWVAWTVVAGEPAPLQRWPELIAASRAFHAALVDVPAPPWLRRGPDPWAVAERAVWEDMRVDVAPELADLVNALRAARRPVRLPVQVVHADFAGILDDRAGEDEIGQLLPHALEWRLFTDSLGRSDPEGLRAVRAANAAVVELLLSRV